MLVAQAFDDLAHAMRVLLEARLGANQLFRLDYAEAVGNIEAGLSRVLDAFHSLYDAMEKEGIRNRVDWYAKPELCALLAIRNARHHNLCGKIRTIFRYHDNTVTPPTDRRKYLIVTYPPGEEDATSIDVPLSFNDLFALLELQTSESRLRGTTRQIVSEYMSFDKIFGELNRRRLTAADTMFDVVSLIVNAGIAIHPHIADRIQHLSTESKHFDFHFKHVPLAKMHEPEFAEINFFRPS